MSTRRNYPNKVLERLKGARRRIIAQMEANPQRADTKKKAELEKLDARIQSLSGHIS